MINQKGGNNWGKIGGRKEIGKKKKREWGKKKENCGSERREEKREGFWKEGRIASLTFLHSFSVQKCYIYHITSI